MIEIEQQYSKVPMELKILKRWCLYATKEIINEKTGVKRTTKIPGNALTGKPAQTNNPNTWTSFSVACQGFKKYSYIQRYDKVTGQTENLPVKGLGFMLGDGIFGVDLDFHPEDYEDLEERKSEQEKFNEIVKEFLTHLKSYAEYSQSGKGIHIICKGYLPSSERRKGSIEMYDNLRFFAMTGNAIQDNNIVLDIVDCTERIKPLHDKYLVDHERNNPKNIVTFGTHTVDLNLVDPQRTILKNQKILSDIEVLEVIKNKDKSDFYYLLQGYRSPNNDESQDDFRIFSKLAFWCDKDLPQMVRIFENSGYFQSKDQYHKNKWINRPDYRDRVINQVLATTSETYKEFNKEYINTNAVIGETQKVELKYEEKVDGNVIDMDRNNVPFNPRNKKTFREFDYTDTGNAERFAFYYNDVLRYNVDNQKFLTFDGKVWREDSKEMVNTKKFVDDFLLLLKEQSIELGKNINEIIGRCLGKQEGDPEFDELEKAEAQKNAFDRNIQRLSNQNGKNAMLNELKHLGVIPIHNSDLDSKDTEINTQSGIVDMITGNIRPHTKEDLVTKITSCGVCKEPPKRWLQFLDEIWTHDSILEEDKKELIDFLQKYLGYCLTGMKQNELCGIMYGTGGNGKSVIVETLNSITTVANVGNYGKPINGDLFANSKYSTGNVENAFAEIYGIRLGIINETDKSMVFNSKFIKKIASHGEMIQGRFLFGNSFYFYPKFKALIITNHKPQVEDTDDGIWDRLFIIPLPNKFRGTPQEDLFLNDKLRAELPSILWWMIEGYIKLYNQDKGKLRLPKRILQENLSYRKDNDIVARYLDDNCDLSVGKDYKTQASILFEDFSRWCNINKATTTPMSSISFKKELETKGYTQVRTSKGKFYLGIKMLKDKVGHSFASALKDKGENNGN